MILVTGASGFVGQHVVKRLRGAGYGVAAYDSVGVNLLRRANVIALFEKVNPTAVIHLAKPPSDGISTMQESPATLMHDILQMDLNVIDACAGANILPKLICVGSVCAYPEVTRLPTDESQLWNGYPEPVNAPYGIAKRTQLALLQAYRQQYGLNSVHLILPNVYGPGDRSGHVIPALIERMRVAKRDNTEMVVWGDPEVTRSFLYVEDAAEGIVRALGVETESKPINLARMEETAMWQLVATLRQLLTFEGAIRYDATKPTGHRLRSFSINRLARTFDWIPQTPLVEGLTHTVNWSLQHVALPAPA